MNEKELERLKIIERRIAEIAKESGLLTTDITFEVVPAKRMLEGMAYMFPVNYSHWTFGRDYDRYRTIYEHTGTGIPYEQVWNFKQPRAFLVKTNPFVLTVLTICHVYGHVDYFLSNRFLQHGRSFSDIAEEAMNASLRFREHETKYGKEGVERTIDAGRSIELQQYPDPLFEEELNNDAVRERVLEFEREKIKHIKSSRLGAKETEGEIQKIEDKLRYLAKKVPPEPIFDFLGYIIRYSPILEPWQKDILSVIRNQARALAPNRHTKMLDEGWATYWHLQIMRRLFKEGILTLEEHDVFNDFHSRVTQEHKMGFNWYRIGLSLFEYIKECYDRGKFGREYEECEDSVKRAYWNTGANQGAEKIFEVRSLYSDRMAVETFFTDEFIRQMNLYFYEEEQDEQTGDIIYTISETRPRIVRNVLKQNFALYGIQPICIENANFNGNRELFLAHRYYGLELEQNYRKGTMEHIFYLWGNIVHLKSVVDGKEVLFSFDGKNHKSIK